MLDEEKVRVPNPFGQLRVTEVRLVISRRRDRIVGIGDGGRIEDAEFERH